MWAVYSVIVRKMGRLGYPVAAVTRRIFFYGLVFMAPMLGAVVSSNYIYAVPVITVAASMVVLKEPITVMGGIGMLLTLAGLAISAA